MENYVHKDFGNTSLQVLDGQVLVEIIEEGKNYSLETGQSIMVCHLGYEIRQYKYAIILLVAIARQSLELRETGPGLLHRVLNFHTVEVQGHQWQIATVEC